MPTGSQGQTRVWFTATMPGQEGKVVTANVCCLCWFISVMPMQHRCHQTFQYPYYYFLQHNIIVCNAMAFNGISNRSVCRVTKPGNIQLSNRLKKSKSTLIPLTSRCINEYQVGMWEEYCTSRQFTPTESVWSKPLPEWQYKLCQVLYIVFRVWQYKSIHHKWSCIMMYTV
jgi:hypothetical protein